MGIQPNRVSAEMLRCSIILRIFDVSANQGQQVGGRFVPRGQAAIQSLQVPPAHGSFNVFGGFSLLQ